MHPVSGVGLAQSLGLELACPGVWPEGTLRLRPDEDIALDNVGQHDVAVIAGLTERKDGGRGLDFLLHERQRRVPCIKNPIGTSLFWLPPLLAPHACA